MPEALEMLSAQRVSEEGVYLLENGFEALLFFGQACPPAAMLAVLGAKLSYSHHLLLICDGGQR